MTVTTTTAEAATASAPHESPDLRGRLDDGAAAARTEALFARHSRTVNGLCRALLRDRAEAEDAAQQTFLSAHRSLLNGAVPNEPAAWLATIARNECWARIRSRMREPLPAEHVDAVSTAPDPLAEAIRRADLALLWSAIEALPRQQRDALLLREFGGLTYEELAEALAVTDSAVESLLFRARQRLRVQLRAAYASLAGASWLETLARLFAGSSAPVAAKVAALGVGAAALGSSAVVVPHVFDNHTPKAPVQATRTRRPAPVRADPFVRRPPIAELTGTVAVPPATSVVVHEQASRSRRSSGGPGPPDSAGDRRGRDGGGEAEHSTTLVGQPVERQRESSSAGPGGEDDSSGSARDGSSGKDGGGGEPTTTTAVVTDTAAVTPAAPDSGRDGDSGGHGGDSGGSDGSGESRESGSQLP